jgi:predicted metal-binding membrane protein
LTDWPSFSPRGLLLERGAAPVVLSLIALCVLAWLYLVHLAGQMAAMEGLAGRMMGMPVADAMSMLLEAALSPTAAAIVEVSANFVLVALMWAVMMIGMMLPSAAPTILLFSALERRRPAGGVTGRSACFVTGYIAAWGLFSVTAAAAQTTLARTGLLSMDMAATSTLLAGAIFVAAGAYELTPIKGRCLVHCQSPLEWIPRHMRPGRSGAFRMGVEHGIYCVGCCWALMLLLFVGGVMNLVWIAVIAAFVLAQKLMPRGPVFARLGGTALLLGGTALMLRGMVALS